MVKQLPLKQWTLGSSPSGTTELFEIQWGRSVAGYYRNVSARWTENPKAKVRLLPAPQI